MLSEKLQIYLDTYKLVEVLYRHMSNVPKAYRYGEYGRASSMSFEALDMIYVANSSQEERPAALTRYLQLIGGVRSRMRLMSEMKILPPKMSVNVQFLLDKVSRQAIGWRNASHRPEPLRQGNAGESHLDKR